MVDAAADAETSGLVVLTGSLPSARHPERSALWFTPDFMMKPLSVSYRSASLDLLSVVTALRQGVIYAGGSASDTHAPALLRSVDHGASWQQLAPPSALKVGVFTVVYVDAHVSSDLLLRASGADQDELMRSLDGGDTLERVLDVQGRLRRVARLADGRLAVLTQLGDEQRLYVGPLRGPFEERRLSRRFRDMTVQGMRLIGLIESELFSVMLVVSDDLGITWVERRGVGADAQLSSCHVGVPECVAGCQVMASFGFLDGMTCGGETTIQPAALLDAGTTQSPILADAVDASTSDGDARPPDTRAGADCSIASRPRDRGYELAAFALLIACAMLRRRTRALVERERGHW
ncbi:MAG: hypothetical protein RL701_1955 [Pseudomonadota bacterium]